MQGSRAGLVKLFLNRQPRRLKRRHQCGNHDPARLFFTRDISEPGAGDPDPGGCNQGFPNNSYFISRGSGMIQDGGGFNFYQVFRRDQPLYFDHRRAGFDFPEKFAVCFSIFFPAADIGNKHPRSYYVL